MYLTIYKSDVKKFGGEEAIVLMYLRLQLKSFKETKQNYHKNRFWVHGTYESISNDVEVFGPTRIRRIMDKLIKLGIIIKDRFNDDPWDKSNWYTINSEKITVGV